jgi:DNA-binding transcriptional ArsR family regulator
MSRMSARPQKSAEPQVNGKKTLGPVLEFMRALWALDHALQSASKRMESRLRITAPQRLVVRIVGRYPGTSAGELSEILHLHPSTLTGILRRLGEHGLVERQPDPATRGAHSCSSRPRGAPSMRAAADGRGRRAARSAACARWRCSTREVAEALASELARID